MSDDGSAAVEVASGEIDLQELHELEHGTDGPVLAEDLAEGDLLDGIYRLGTTLGEGAMGRIFEAQDIDLNRRVAIKVPLIEEAVDILIAEARAMAALRHRNLPVVHAAGRHHGVNYLVMERLSGVDLDRHCTETYDEGYSLPLEEALEILIRVTDALTAIHLAGVAHRDVKPENVLLCKRGPVLIDFGLVAPASANEAIQGGSPCYVAPEIITNTAVRSSRHLADIYSLGIMAYEMLTGEVPFDHDDIPPLLAMHISAPIPDVRRLRPNVPAKLAILIKEMMAKSPGERPSAEEALWSLQALLKSTTHDQTSEKKVVLVASDDLALVGRLSRLFDEWLDDVKVRVCRSSDAVLFALAERTPALMLVDVTLQDMSGLELLMQLNGSGVSPADGMIALTQSVSSKDVALLERFDVMCAVPRGQELREPLFRIVQNSLRPRPTQGWQIARPSRA